LSLFGDATGQKVNGGKTRIFFSKNVLPNQENAIRRASGFATTTDLGKYLGIPLLH
jgi:hypothetical protein